MEHTGLARMVLALVSIILVDRCATVEFSLTRVYASIV